MFKHLSKLAESYLSLIIPEQTILIGPTAEKEYIRTMHYLWKSNTDPGQES